MTRPYSADAAAALCAAAGLVVTGIDVCATDTWVDVAPFKPVPETIIRRLYSAGAYFVEYGWQHDGEYFVLADKAP